MQTEAISKELTMQEKAKLYDELQEKSHLFDGECFDINDFMCYSYFKCAYLQFIDKHSIANVIADINEYIISIAYFGDKICNHTKNKMLSIEVAANISTFLAYIEDAWINRMELINNN